MGDLIAVFLALTGSRADPCTILDGLDVVRAMAHASGDDSVLGLVYPPGTLLDTDQDTIRQWRGRGYVLAGVRMQRRECVAVGRHQVRVIERLGPVAAVDATGASRALPRDGWDERTITLVRRDGSWWIGSTE